MSIIPPIGVVAPIGGDPHSFYIYTYYICYYVT